MFKLLKSFIDNIKKLIPEDIEETPEHHFGGMLDEFNFENTEEEEDMCYCNPNCRTIFCDSFACQTERKKQSEIYYKALNNNYNNELQLLLSRYPELLDQYNNNVQVNSCLHNFDSLEKALVNCVVVLSKENKLNFDKIVKLIETRTNPSMLYRIDGTPDVDSDLSRSDALGIEKIIKDKFGKK